MEIEVWIRVKGYSSYQVSNLGRVRNISFKKHKKILKGCFDKDGYIISQLRNDNDKKETKKFHRLVAIAWIPNPENKPFVNHINGIKDDNRKVNLEWNTAKENNDHAYKTGLKKGVPSKYLASLKGSLNINSRKVINVKTNQVFDSIKEASEFYSINYNILSKNLNGQNKNKTDLIYKPTKL